MHPEIKFYKSNWLVVSAWSYHTKVPGSNPTIFRKKYIRFFFCFPYDGPLFDSHGFIKIFFAPISHSYYIYKTSYTFPKQKRWMVKVYQHYHTYLVRNGHTKRRKTGKRSDTTRRRTEGGRVREPQRLGMSQGTMNREPKYGGGAHPKYGSCRGVVSLIPRAFISRCPYEVSVVRRRRSYF
jgi:hypothetical protein